MSAFPRLQTLNDWQVDRTSNSALHKSGLTIQIENSGSYRYKKGTLDISGLDKLSGTEWSTRANVLVEQGIALLES